MTAPRIAAIGGHYEADLAHLNALGSRTYPSLKDALAMPETDRAAVEVIAYKTHDPLDDTVMSSFPALGLIANFGVGHDQIDLEAARARGVAVTNTPDVLDDDVADLAVGMALMQCRQMRQGDAWVRNGDWADKGPMPLNTKMTGARAGILGLGRIGFEIADRLAGFKMDIHYWSRSPKETPGWTYHDDPVALAGAVDILFVSVVGGPQTENIVDAAVMDALGPDGVLINISRGTTVDEEALIAALGSGRLGGAGLDVFLNEPAPDGRFADLPNVVLQPHQASATHATRGAMGQLMRDNIDAYLDGRPLVTPVT